MSNTSTASTQMNIFEDMYSQRLIDVKFAIYNESHKQIAGNWLLTSSIWSQKWLSFSRKRARVVKVLKCK